MLEAIIPSMKRWSKVQPSVRMGRISIDDPTATGRRCTAFTSTTMGTRLNGTSGARAMPSPASTEPMLVTNRASELVVRKPEAGSGRARGRTSGTRRPASPPKQHIGMRSSDDLGAFDIEVLPCPNARRRALSCAAISATDSRSADLNLDAGEVAPILAGDLAEDVHSSRR
jgi:hypothetical protein